MEEVFAGVRQGDGTELGHGDAVVLLVGLVAVTGQEAAFVRHLTFGYFELVQEGHPVKPVVEPGKEQTNGSGERNFVTSKDASDDSPTSGFRSQTSRDRFLGSCH